MLLIISSGCSLFSKKNSESIERLQKYQEEVNKKMDSIRQQDYKELMDSVNNNMKKEIDSLKHKSDSLDKEIDKTMKKLNHDRKQIDKKSE
jgi:septal ring factor EnvC (AmiA/AmiB activator)